MDVWVVAAAAGAGYVAQRLKVLTSGKHNREDCSSSNQGYQNASGTEIASTSGFEGQNMAALDNFARWGVSYSNSLAGFLNKEDNQVDQEGRVPFDIDDVSTRDLVSEPSSSEMGFSYRFRRNRSRIRSRRIKSPFIKPRTSLESCLMAQLYKEHDEIEEYSYSAHLPGEQTVRPFLVSDGSRVISRRPRESFCEPAETRKSKLWKDSHAQKNDSVLGVPRLPNVVPVESEKKVKAKSRKEQDPRSGNNGKMVNGSLNNSHGSSDVALIFYLGLTMGIIYSFLANKREAEKLNILLKQTENLVQDLQDELEMKDSLTVKELPVENYESQGLHNDSYSDDAVKAMPHKQKLNGIDQESCDQDAHAESLSKIEAELEVELERLESSVNSSRLEGKLFNVAEIDPDFVSDVIKGDLRVDLFRAKTGKQTYADKDESSSTTPRSVRYPVSPRELSLRLHEVIQSRLGERVKELETALQYSENKIKSLESGLWSKFGDCKTNSSSNYDISISGNVPQVVAQPVVISLSGEALAAYNEASGEFAKMSESDEEDLHIGFNESVSREILQSHAKDFDVVRNGGSNGYTVTSSQKEENHKAMSNDFVFSSRDESEDGGDDDEMERLLIRQIVEKARQGSPSLLKAQRALLSTIES